MITETEKNNVGGAAVNLEDLSDNDEDDDSELDRQQKAINSRATKRVGSEQRKLAGISC